MTSERESRAESREYLCLEVDLSAVAQEQADQDRGRVVAGVHVLAQGGLDEGAAPLTHTHTVGVGTALQEQSGDLLLQLKTVKY